MAFSPRSAGDEAERSLQLEAARWKSMVFEIEELLNGYVALGDRLEDQAQRLADNDNDEPTLGRNELEVGQEAMIRARIKSAKVSGKVSDQSSMDIAQLRAELAMLESSQNEQDAMGSQSPTASPSISRASERVGSLFGSLSPTTRGYGASASTNFFRQLPSAGEVASMHSGGFPSPRTPGSCLQVPVSPGKMTSAVNAVRNAIRLQQAGRMAVDSSTTPRVGSSGRLAEPPDGSRSEPLARVAGAA